MFTARLASLIPARARVVPYQWIFLANLSLPDLSTLHALRDTTLAHTHTLLSHLHKNHSLPASYRLLARSPAAPSSPNGPTPPGWGCIRLAPQSAHSPISTQRQELRPVVRRSSAATSPKKASILRNSLGLGLGGKGHEDGGGAAGRKLIPEVAVYDGDEEEDERERVSLKEGYLSGANSEDEEEEECADWIVAREVAKRGAKEG